MKIDLKKVVTFMQENAFCFATTDENGNPRVRPFCTCMEHENKLYIIMSETMHPDQKDIRPVWKQVMANPNIAICAWDKTKKWLRITGVVKEDTSVELKRKMIGDNRIMDDFTTNDDDEFQRIFLVANMKIELRGNCAECCAGGNGFCTHDNCKRQRMFFN
ncbi:MAG: pyridoxamine 5'-phosphate oxidase family protein [Firmicutes bacterium]|nr:pyridoxamine 5'-phosphate oxidase family protein [Bacillota bacterium]